ncbi:MAG: threonylcarbamoyl-AMP synthase [Euryarchaeota archaeon]|nr:threonylcarbamoyl-AMP synthase [Euryarchaeota archaeon]
MGTRRVGPGGLGEAAEVLRRGGLVAYPTETLYGLGARVVCGPALRRLWAVKRRPPAQAVSLAVARVGEVGEWARVDGHEEIIRGLLPGPVTVVLPAGPRVPPLLVSQTGGVAIRVPEHPLARRLLEQAGPLTATSANLHGAPAPVRAEEVHVECDLVLDGGPCPLARGSTVVDLAGGRILREGAGLDRVRRVLEEQR